MGLESLSWPGYMILFTNTGQSIDSADVHDRLHGSFILGIHTAWTDHICYMIFHWIHVLVDGIQRMDFEMSQIVFVVIVRYRTYILHACIHSVSHYINCACSCLIWIQITHVHSLIGSSYIYNTNQYVYWLYRKYNRRFINEDWLIIYMYNIYACMY